MLKLACETRIRATPETVFGIITDIRRYAEWNPWNVRGEGEPVPGATIGITALVGKREMKVKHKILELRPFDRFVWCDVGFASHLFYSERARYLQRDGDGVHYRVELTTTGPLAWLVEWQMARSLHASMAAEMEALKQRAEARG
jgi:polyketide cyclase/dehydrase/lipid transport protein